MGQIGYGRESIFGIGGDKVGQIKHSLLSGEI